MNILILCPHHKSQVTLEVMRLLLLRQDITIVGVVIRRITLRRFIQESKRDGFVNLIKKYIKKSKMFYINFNRISSKINEISSIYQYKKVIPIIKLNDFRNIEGIDRVDLILFTGGGYVFPDVLLKTKVVNCHMGILPFYRGMDVVEWPFIYKDYVNIGLTTHLMSKRIDFGPIIEKKFLNFLDYSGFAELREHMLELIPEMLVNSIDLVKINCYQDQNFEDGDIYFKMCEKFKIQYLKYHDE
jgi:methionyl-tRNA formyltransferase